MLFWIVAAWIAIPGAPFSLASDPPARNVLLLNSYHKGLDWTDKITAGVESVLKGKELSVDIRVEYLDTKHVNAPEHYRMLYQSYKYKFANSRFDVIISSDDDAFNFLLKNRDDLFPGTPVVFCGVNYFRDSMLAGRSDFTGVVESFDVKSTLEVALKAHPDTRQVYIFVDNTVTGVANRKIAAEALAARANRVEGVFIENLYIEEIREKGFYLPPASIVLMMTFPRDRHGNVSEENLLYVSGKCNVPIYSVWDFFLGRGIVGGMITSGFSQGEAAAKLARRILSGEKAGSIPVVKESPNRYIFDYAQMRRFGVKRSDLPEGGVFINAPYSLYRERPEWVWGFATVIAVLASIIGILIANILRRKKAEEALRESEERYRTLVETSPDAVVLADIGGRVLMANRQAAKIYGVESVEELLGLNGFGFIVPEERQMAADNLEITLEKSDIRLAEYTLTRKDGGRFLAELCVSIVTGKDGKPRALIIVARDITERKRAEEKLRESENRYRHLFEELTDAAMLGDAETGMILDANTRAEELLGRPRVEIIGMHQNQVHPPEESEKYRRMFPGHIEKKVAREVEGELVRKDGKKVPVAINASTMTIEGKHLILGIFRDITERRKAEDALRESEEQYRSLVEASSDGIVRFDIDGKILMVNRQCVRMCGYESPGEFPGRNIFEFIAPEDHERAAGNIRKLLDAGGTLLEEYTLLRKDGARFQTETSASVIPDSGGKPNGFVVVVRDVTERRGLEKQLFHALKMEAVGRLAGGLAHDINNYLGAITGFSDLVKITHGKDKALAKRMDAIAETALRASSLIRQLLSFSRRQPTVPEVLNLNAVIEGMESMMGRLIGEDVKLATRLAGNPRNVKADPSQVEQILVNLLVNARDAMPHGGEVTIETANVEFNAGESGIPGFMKPGRYLMLAVSDTGTGIPEEIREKIFDPFFTTKETGKGSGLGLSTVYGIVKQHDGYIQVHSRPGKGAAFKTYFPACEDRVGPSAASPDLLPCARQGVEKVLLAEDNDDVRESTTEILEALGYKVQAASNGEEALLLFEKQRAEIDLLITDVVMPGMGGKMLADRAREMKKNLKVLFISGYPDEVIATHGVLHEGVNYLQKPFSVSGISGKIREMLD
jgi:PAS domain S-box-containing protein